MNGEICQLKVAFKDCVSEGTYLNKDGDILATLADKEPLTEKVRRLVKEWTGW